MVVDDRYLRIGSANLNNRSMGLDTECDLVIDASDDGGNQEAIRATVATLLAHHAGLRTAELEQAWQKAGALGRVVDKVCEARPNGLCPFPPARDRTRLEAAVAELQVIDPERPLGVDRLVDDVMFRGRIRAPWDALALCIALALLAAVVPWPFPPLALFLVAYFVLGMAGVPLNVFVAASAIFYPFEEAVLASLAGAMAIAGAGYLLGMVATSRLVHRGSYYLMRQPAVRTQVWAVAMIRCFPLAPFAMSSVGAGNAGVKLWPFVVVCLVAGLAGIAVLV
jgi:hypothetical protein